MNPDNPPMPGANVQTLAQLFAWRVAATPRAQAYRQFDDALGQWVVTNWAEAGLRVERWTAALARLGLARGSRVAILLPNGLDAVCVDQAALALACVPLPMHALDNPQSIAYILADSAASVLFVSSLAQWQAIASAAPALPELRLVVVQQAVLPLHDGQGTARINGWQRLTPAPLANASTIRLQRPAIWLPWSTPRARPASPRA
jgi:long-chain acyl-CoA synthetase